EGFSGILRLDAHGNFIDRIPTLEGDPHGMDAAGGSVLVTVENTNEGVGRIDMYTLDGTLTGSIVANRPYDAAFYQGGIIAASREHSALELLNQFGSYAGDFATGIGLIEQVVVQPDDSVITVDQFNFFEPARQGLYHFNADGTLRTLVGTSGA